MKIFINYHKSRIVGVPDMLWLDWDWEKHYAFADILDIKDEDVEHLESVNEWLYMGLENNCKVYGYYGKFPKYNKYRFVAQIIPNGFQNNEDIREAIIGTKKIIEKYGKYYDYDLYVGCSTFEDFFIRYKNNS